MDFPSGCLNLLLTEIGEPEENSLRIVVVEGIAGAPSSLAIGASRIDDVRPIKIRPESRAYEFLWTSYVAYVVRDESYWQAEPDEPPFTGHFHQRSNSSFLDYVAATTFADDSYPGPLTHWGLDTLSHCVAVASVAPPVIRLMGPEEVVRRMS